MTDINQFLQQLDELLALMRARISPVTAIAAVMAAGGIVVMLVGLLSVRRISLDEEAARISGIRAPSRLDQLQMRLYQSGLRIRVAEFLLIGCCVGVLLGAADLLPLLDAQTRPDPETLLRTTARCHP
jgi:hypothetical protein